MDVKERIKKIVADYKSLYPREYSLIVEILIEKRKLVIDKFGRIDKNSDTRALFELPETLSQMLISTLSGEDLKWHDTKEGARWFVRSYPEFRLAPEI